MTSSGSTRARCAVTATPDLRGKYFVFRERSNGQPRSAAERCNGRPVAGVPVDTRHSDSSRGGQAGGGARGPHTNASAATCQQQQLLLAPVFRMRRGSTTARARSRRSRDRRSGAPLGRSRLPSEKSQMSPTVSGNTSARCPPTLVPSTAQQSSRSLRLTVENVMGC
jgi:hypothetical protein